MPPPLAPPSPVAFNLLIRFLTITHHHHRDPPCTDEDGTERAELAAEVRAALADAPRPNPDGQPLKSALAPLKSADGQALSSEEPPKQEGGGGGTAWEGGERTEEKDGKEGKKKEKKKPTKLQIAPEPR